MKNNRKQLPVLSLSLCFVTVFIAGCANIGGEDISLLPSSKILDPLEVPPGLTPLEESDQFVIPDEVGEGYEGVSLISKEQFRNAQSWEAFQEYQEFKRQDAGEDVSKEDYDRARTQGEGIFRVQEFKTSEGKTRLIVYDSMQSVWNRVNRALHDLNVRIVKSDEAARVIYVKGIRPQESPTLLQRMGIQEYSGRIDEFHLEQISADAIAIVPKSEFQDEIDYSSSDELAKQLRFYLLALYQVAPEGSEVPSAVAVKKRIYLDANGRSVIEMVETFDNAWVRVGRTLEAAGMEIQDLNRSEGTYIVSRTPVEEVKRSKWRFWRKKSERKVGDTETFVINVETRGETTAIYINPSNEENVQAEEEMMNILYERLTT